MDQIYNVHWSETGMLELVKMYPYSLEIKEKIYADSLKRLQYLPTLSAESIPFGEWEGYWAKLGVYKVILIYDSAENTRDFSHEMNRLGIRRVFWHVDYPTCLEKLWYSILVQIAL